MCESGSVTVRAARRAGYTRLDAEFTAAGGYASESEASSIASSLALDERILTQPLRTLSGGQRRRIELARILFSGAETLLGHGDMLYMPPGTSMPAVSPQRRERPPSRCTRAPPRSDTRAAPIGIRSPR